MSATSPHWEHFAHGADVGLRGIGASLEEAFEQAAMALTATICEPHLVRPAEPVEVRCESADPELLLVDWLQAIIYEMATRDMLFGAFDVSIDGPSLTGRLSGERVDPVRHEPAIEIKGATHTALRVAKQSDGSWMAQCVVDV